jgi:CBS domain containing-hemolysin-like protein
MSTAQTWAEVVILAACVVIAAVASATETAMTSVGRLRVRHLAEDGSQAAAILQRLQQDPNRFLSTILVMNTVALILASSATTLLAQTFLPHQLGFWGDLAVSLVLSVFLLIFAEVTPKTVAFRNADRIALMMAGPVEALSGVLRPILWFITLVSRAITGGRAARAPYLTEQELMTMLSVSEEQGVIEEEERQMIHGIIEIGDKTVREVMVPRTDITAVERSTPLKEIVKIFKETGHTRLPVCEGDFDHIVGRIHAKDLLLFLANGPQEFDINRMMRPMKYVPASKKVDELLHQMQTEKVHMMIVLDEYGGTAGLVTLEDLLEEIVGEIRDEYDQAEEEPFVVLNEREALVDARFSMGELNERLQLGLEESDDYDSVGGYIYATLGEVPEEGATFKSGKVQWTVEEVNGRRIVRVRLRSDEPWPDEILQAAGLPVPQRDGSAQALPEQGTGGH